MSAFAGATADQIAMALAAAEVRIRGLEETAQ